MNTLYKGAIVEESLEDNRILNDFRILQVKITTEDDSSERWHIYTVEASKAQLERLSGSIKPNKWYAHFWDTNGHVIAVFRGKTFEFDFDNKDSWRSAIEYGISIGIPKEQLDFIID